MSTKFLISKFKISNSQVPLLNCIILITSPRSLDYLVKTKTIENCKKNEFMVIGKKTTQRLKQWGCKKKYDYFTIDSR